MVKTDNILLNVYVLNCASLSYSYEIKLPLYLWAAFLFFIAAQEWPPQRLIISNLNQKASSLFITKYHEREQCPDLTTLARLHNNVG